MARPSRPDCALYAVYAVPEKGHRRSAACRPPWLGPTTDCIVHDRRRRPFSPSSKCIARQTLAGLFLFLFLFFSFFFPLFSFLSTRLAYSLRDDRHRICLKTPSRSIACSASRCPRTCMNQGAAAPVPRRQCREKLVHRRAFVLSSSLGRLLWPVFCVAGMPIVVLIACSAGCTCLYFAHYSS